MAKNVLASLKSFFEGKDPKPALAKEGYRVANVKEMERLYEADELKASGQILCDLLENYGTRKKKNHRLKGREFIHFILSHKHKDLKNVGYTHWENVNKIVHGSHDKAYPYHKENLRKAIDFFRKEIKSINLFDLEVPK